ncbi:MAG: cupin domain-containing protein [Bacteroidales bacterium]|nr:cupin domain-containing protein [Bacteroidales bacterium]
MTAIDMKNVPASTNAHGIETKKFHENEHVQAVHITLKPGEQLKKHITPVDVFFYVLEGTGIVEIGEEKKEVGIDTYVDSPAQIPHCWYNESSEILRILVVKTPKPVAKAKIL